MGVARQARPQLAAGRERGRRKRCHDHTHDRRWSDGSRRHARYGPLAESASRDVCPWVGVL